MPKVAVRQKSLDAITGNWQSPDGLWFNPSDPSGSKTGDTILLTLNRGKSKAQNFIGLCTSDDNDATDGSRQQVYDLYKDLNKNGLVDNADSLAGPFWIYTYGFVSSPIKSGTFEKLVYDGPLYIRLSSPDAYFTDPPGPVGYGGTAGSKDYFV
jgi:hypothetical protein